VDSKIKFLVTPINEQCVVGVAEQADGSFVTQIRGEFRVKNRMDEPLHLVTVRLIRPKIKGEIVQSFVSTRSLRGDVYGSENAIPARHVLPVSVSIFIRGLPRHKKGAIKVRLEVGSANAEKAHAVANMRFFGPPPRSAASSVTEA
jgi:hypothetical protein